MKPVIVLRRMTPREYRDFSRLDIENYAKENVKAGRWTVKESSLLAKEAHRRIMPKGLATPGHYFFVSETVESRNSVGYSWMQISGKASKRRAFIYSLLIDDKYRGLGYGRATLSALEHEAHLRGARTIELHVFAQNKKALGLYERSGYRTTSLNMSKVLAKARQ